MCSKFFAATKQIEEGLLLLLWFFFWERKRRKERNERKKAKRDLKSRWVRLKRKKRDLQYYLFYSNLCMKNNVARCIRAVQKRQEVNFNNSFFYTIWFYLKIIEKKWICRAYYILLKQLLTEIVCCCHRLKLWRRPHYTTVNLLNNCDKFYLCLLFLLTIFALNSTPTH